MIDDWLLEHLAKITSLSCILIVIYFLVYSTWRIAQMPNNPWNWNDWQWPFGGGRNAVEIYRKPTEMPFTLTLEDGSKEISNKIVFTLNFLKDRPFPSVIVMWCPSAPYLMKLIHSPWDELRRAIMLSELEAGQWESNLGGAPAESEPASSPDYFIIHRLQISEATASSSGSSVLLDSYQEVKLDLSPPVEFDWNLLRNQYRYPAAVFLTANQEYALSSDSMYYIGGIIQVLHVKNEMFQKASATLAQYIKMSTGQSHLLQSLYVMDDIRADEEEEESSDATNENDLTSESVPFRDILCSVCQVSPVTRVIIPCRHVCLCTQCFEKVETCPICRGMILYYFATKSEAVNPVLNNPSTESITPTTWRHRIERWNERFSDALGLTRP